MRPIKNIGIMPWVLLGILAVTILCSGANYPTYNNVRVAGNLTANQWVRVYNTTLSANATSVNITGLDGDTDIEYVLKTRIVSAVASTNFKLTFNSDTASNYPRQYVYGTATTASAWRGAADGLLCGQSMNEGVIAHTLTHIFAKSGSIRTAIHKLVDHMSTTTVSAIAGEVYVWNNTASNLASLLLSASETDGLGIGSTIELYKPIASQ